VLSGLAARASLWNRRRKLALFMERIRPGPQTRVVDVGVGDTGFGTEPGVASSHNFFEALYPWPERIIAVSDVPLPNFAQEFPAITTVTASGTDLPFEDDAFDVAFSNAVVEHVGSRDEQRRFVAELCRVAPRVFLSTPNRWFPLETHTLVPFVHWLPRPVADRIFGALGKDGWKRVDLLTKRELLELFPPSVEARVIESRITISVAATRATRVSALIPSGRSPREGRH
jgi:SAM-dependent methyltransferase